MNHTTGLASAFLESATEYDSIENLVHTSAQCLGSIGAHSTGHLEWADANRKQSQITNVSKQKPISDKFAISVCPTNRH